MPNTLCYAQDSQCDPDQVRALVAAATSAMQRASIPDITTPSEVISAAFTLLAQMLVAVRDTQQPEDRATNAKEIQKVLQDLLLDFGQVPN